MGMRRRWKLFWNLLAFFTVATVVRQWDPKVEDSDLAFTAAVDLDGKAVWDAYRAVRLGVKHTVRGKRITTDKMLIFANADMGWAYAQAIVDDNEEVISKLHDLTSNPEQIRTQAAYFQLITGYDPDPMATLQLAQLLELATIVHLRRNEPQQALQATHSGASMAMQLASSSENLMIYQDAITGAQHTLRAARAVAADPSTRKEDLRLLAESIEQLRRNSTNYYATLGKEYQFQWWELAKFEERIGAGIYHSFAPRTTWWERARNRLRILTSYKPNATRAMIADRVRTTLSATRPEHLQQPLTNSVWYQTVATWAESSKSVETKLSKFRPNFIGERYLMLQDITCDYEYLFRAHCEYLCALDLTALFIAMHQHCHDHGEFPPNLEALSGVYLPRIPLDRFDGLPLRYDPESRLIYSHWPVDSERGWAVAPWTASEHEPNFCPLRDNGCTVLYLIPRAPDDVVKPNKRSP